MTVFGDVLRALLAGRGWSLRELARRSNYDVGHLSKVINGHKPASRELAGRLDELLGAGGRLIALAPAPDAYEPVRPARPAGWADEVRRLSEQVAALTQALSSFGPVAHDGPVRRVTAARPAVRPRVRTRFCSRE